MIRNIHSRSINAQAAAAGSLLNSLAGDNDRLWPHETWPPMRLRGGLQEGAAGGHGPVRYKVKKLDPGKSVLFTFLHDKPGLSKGLVGEHSFLIKSTETGKVEIRHRILAHARGKARFLWPLVIRPLHDALIEDCLDKAEFELTGALPKKPARWSPWVRFLRGIIGKAKRR